MLDEVDGNGVVVSPYTVRLVQHKDKVHITYCTRKKGGGK